VPSQSGRSASSPCGSRTRCRPTVSGCPPEGAPWPTPAEASFRQGEDNPDGLHLTGREAGEAAARTGVRRLVLTHVPPWYAVADALDEAAEVYDGHLTAAAPGAAYDV
jgi:hypothetical protein